MFVSMLSVPHGDKRLYATAPGFPCQVLERARADDPVWHDPAVRCEWEHYIDTRAARLKPRDKIIFRVA